MRSLVVVLMMCALALLGGVAQADEQANAEAAKTAFKEGATLFESNDYAAALRAFRRAYEIRAHDKVRIPIAACLEKLGRIREAVEEVEHIAKSEHVTDEQRRDAGAARARLEGKLGILKVTGSPEGADVLVDQEVRCHLPCRIPVDPGEHVVLVRSGERQRSERLLFKSGEQRIIEVSLVLSKPKPAPATTPRPVIPVTPDPQPIDTTSRGPGVMTWLGLGLAVVGAVGVVGFGLHADAKHEDYLAAATDELRDEGLLARGLSNASIAVAGLGAVLVFVDLVFIAPSPTEPTEPTARLTRDGLVLTF